MRAEGYELGHVVRHALSDRDEDERRRVLRALLQRPLLHAADDPELFRAARRHADALREWLAREAGWRLLVEAQTVRLVAPYVPHGPTATATASRHPARARKGDPAFTRRRYVLLCLALAVLERSDHQVTLGQLAEQVVRLARQPGLEEVDFALEGHAERSDLVAAIRVLLSYGVLVRVVGDEDAYVSSGGDALYDVDRRVLSSVLVTEHPPALVASRLGPSAPIDELEVALHAVPPAYTEEESNRRLRQSIARRLLSDPVIYYEELPEPERSYLQRGQRVSLSARLAEATGLVPELRAEGLALVDPEDELTDVRMPEQGTDGHATLLLAEHLASRGPSTIAALRAHTRRLAHAHGAYWRRTAREPGAEEAIVSDALDRLVGLGLVRVDGNEPGSVVSPLPALRRFAVAAPTVCATRSRNQG